MVVLAVHKHPMLLLEAEPSKGMIGFTTLICLQPPYDFSAVRPLLMCICCLRSLMYKRFAEMSEPDVERPVLVVRAHPGADMKFCFGNFCFTRHEAHELV